MDVTEKRQAETRIAYMAQHGALTGLPNRILFHERLDEALECLRRNKEKLAILYLDLDQFKNVYDTLGHPVGDLLLMAAAGTVCGCACAISTLLQDSAAMNSRFCKGDSSDPRKRAP